MTTQVWISSGSAIVRQILVLCFFVPFLALFGYLVLFKNFSIAGVLLLALALLIAFFIVKRVLMTRDILIEDDLILVRSIFGTKKRPLPEFKDVGSSFMPFTYYVEFDDGEKNYFAASPEKIIKQFFEPKSGGIENELRDLFLKAKKVTSHPLETLNQ